MISLAAIMGQEEGSVNAQRLGRDFRKVMAKSGPIRRQSGRPSTCSLIAARDASILAHFSHAYVGLTCIRK